MICKISGTKKTGREIFRAWVFQIPHLTGCLHGSGMCHENPLLNKQFQCSPYNVGRALIVTLIKFPGCTVWIRSHCNKVKTVMMNAVAKICRFQRRVGPYRPFCELRIAQYLGTKVTYYSVMARESPGIGKIGMAVQ